MTKIVPSHDLVVVRETETEVLGGGPVTGRLYAFAAARPATRTC